MNDEKTCHHGAITDLAACICALEEAYKRAFDASLGVGGDNVQIENRIESLKDGIADIEHDVMAIMGTLITGSPLVVEAKKG